MQRYMQRCQRTSHLTTGSFSLTPFVRSMNMRKGFRLCESVEVNRYVHSVTFTDSTYLGYQ
jgi:hypothetical protein